MFKYYTTGWIPFYCYQFNIGQPPTLFPRDSPHSPPESRRLPSGQHPPDPHLCILMDSFLCIAVGCETIENGNCHRQALVAYAPTTVSAFWSSRIYLSASLYSLTRSALNQHALMFQFGFEANTFYAILRRLRLPRATWFPAFFFSMYNFSSLSRSLLPSSPGTIRVVLPYPPPLSLPSQSHTPRIPSNPDLRHRHLYPRPPTLAFPRIPPHSPLPPARHRHLASALVFHASTPASRSFYAICVAALFVYYHISLLGSVSVGLGGRGVWTRTLVLYSL